MNITESWTCSFCNHINTIKTNIKGQNIPVTPFGTSPAGFICYDADYKQSQVTPCINTALCVITVFKIVVVSFRGTLNAQDIINNRFEPDPKQKDYGWPPGSMIHELWLGEWNDLKANVLAAITVETIFDIGDTILIFMCPLYTQALAKHNPDFVLVTGHNTGGAYAQIASMDIQAYTSVWIKKPTVYVYDYGSPKWGNAAMAKAFETAVPYHFSVVNKHDKIPTMPAGVEWVRAEKEIFYEGVVLTPNNLKTPVECPAVDKGDCKPAKDVSKIYNFNYLGIERFS